jgi:hypothetical protein
MHQKIIGRGVVWLAGLAALLVAVALIAILVASALDKGGSSSSTPPADDVPSITSDQAVTIVKEWIAGGTTVAVAEEFVGGLPCSAYFQGGDMWEVKCRLPWTPVEGYYFRLSEASGEVEPETEATLTFVRLLRQWGHVPEP